MKKNTLGFIAFALILLPFIGGNVKYLISWSSGEMIGYNFFTLICFIGGGLLLHKSFRKNDVVK